LGKPYLSELFQLKATYAAAMAMDINNLLLAVKAMASLPLYVVGSGGSLSVARFIAALHQYFAGIIAKEVTPLEVSCGGFPITKNSSLCYVSAGGKNLDIINAFKAGIAREPQNILVTCARKNSNLSTLAKNYKYVDLFEFDLPSKKDGFLATNSLLAFVTLFARAYHILSNGNNNLPATFEDLIGEKDHLVFLNQLRERCSSLWDRDYFIVLYGNSTQHAAFDLESKFIEAALGSVHIADYRNFAHGRHHWLAKKGDKSAVIALITDKDKKIAEKTIKLIPNNVKVLQLYFPGCDLNAAIRALVTILHIVFIAGEARNIDPGRPGVPEFGRRIYNLRLNKSCKVCYDKNNRRDVAVLRKLISLPFKSLKEDEICNLLESYNQFINKLGNIYFSGIVFDYDGTLIDTRDRFSDISSEVIIQLLRLLENGFVIGIATGRGKSVRIALRKAIPDYFWDKIIVGYYNGSDCGLLSDNDCPDPSQSSCSELTNVMEALNKDITLNNLIEMTIRKKQLTVEFKKPIHHSDMLPLIYQIICTSTSERPAIVTSGHSIDILAKGVSKRTVVNGLRSLIGLSHDAPILCIGDRGQWPGNDFDLLSEPYSISVDEVSSDNLTCWNLSPPGYRGVQATLEILKSIQIEKDGLRILFPES